MFKEVVREVGKRIINDFIERVERRAEEKMIKTGKIKDAYYAAMKE